ncbi:MAG: NAD-dependent deacetylase, partial [Rhodoferax sp.]
GAMARPNVMMFGDWGWLPGRTAMQAQTEDVWLETIGDHQRMVVVELGAGTAIPSVRSFGQRLVYEFGARLVRINPREYAVPSTSDVGLAGGSSAVLEAIDKVLKHRARF